MSVTPFPAKNSKLLSQCILIRSTSYGSFRVGSEDESYRLEVDDFLGDEDSDDMLNDHWFGANGRPFSTYDV